jgi:hypothetical protein
MEWDKRFTALVTVLFLGGIGWWLHGRPQGHRVETKPDLTASPLQQDTERQPFEREGVKIFPRASYVLSGKVVSRRDNHDPFAWFIPVDACVVWGDFEHKLRGVSIESHGRVCYVEWEAGADGAYVMAHLSNNHLVPANPNVRKALAHLDPGDEIQLRGFLVDLSLPVPVGAADVLAEAAGAATIQDQRADWKTSLVRDDEGMGACETMWVESVQIGARLYE